jgi:EpsD family peptidyl-prolyl cis-trans isomerase
MTMGFARHTMLLAGTALACATLAGCNKKPAGQVVATVNGDEVTRRDLSAEMSASGANGGGADAAAVQPLMTKALVDRKLLVQEAKRTKLDTNPQYLALRQRQDDILLAQMLAQSWSGRTTAPSNAQAQQFIAENPLMFSGRKAVLVDEIITSAGSISQAQLRPMNSNNEIAAWLQQNKKKFQRSDKPVDTLRIPKELAQRMLSSPNEPIAVRNGGLYNIVQVKAVRDLPVPLQDQLKLAKDALTQQARMKTNMAEIERLRRTAEISYLPGFVPPAEGKAPTGQ